MKKYLLSLVTALILAGIAAASSAQTPGQDHLTVPFSDPARPGTVKVSLLSGGITVKGYAGKEVVVDARLGDEGRSREREPAPPGMKRISNPSTGLTVEEEDNVISINTGMMNQPVDISLQVPTRTSLKLKTLNAGEIRVDQVSGDLEVNDLNGEVTLNQISGSVVAHALNGKVKVSLVSVDPSKPMSFSSLNGDIDVTLPPEVKANVVMKTDQGEIFSDFDVVLDQTTKPAVEGSEGKGGKYRLKIDRTLHGKINGGGPEFQFKTFNGNIYIRKSSK